MPRCMFFLVVALLAAVVVADYIYSYKQIDEIDDRLVKCLRQVPGRGDFDRPGDTCRFEGIFVLSTGAKKEDITKPIVACLKKKSVKASIISSAEACLVKALSADL